MSKLHNSSLLICIYTYIYSVWFWFGNDFIFEMPMHSTFIWSIWTISSIWFDFQWNSKPFRGCEMNILWIEYLCQIAIYESWKQYTDRYLDKEFFRNNLSDGILCYFGHLNIRTATNDYHDFSRVSNSFLDFLRFPTFFDFFLYTFHV